MSTKKTKKNIPAEPSLEPLCVPSADDPQWSKVGEIHRRFLAERPHHARRIEEELRFRLEFLDKNDIDE